MSEKLSLDEVRNLGTRLTDFELRTIKGSLRRAFRLSPRMNAVLEAARVELPPAIKKDGTEGKRNQIRYRCAHCLGLFRKEDVAVDHIETVVPLYKEEIRMSAGDLARGIFCHVNNLQVLCNTKIKNLPKGAEKSCHYKKTAEEQFLRGEWKAYKKANNILDDWSVFYSAFHEKNMNALNKISNIEAEFKKKYQAVLVKKQKEKELKEARKAARLAKKRM